MYLVFTFHAIYCCLAGSYTAKVNVLVTDKVIYQLPSSVDSVEALAAWRATILAQEMSLTQVVVEGDSLKVIAAINSPKQSRTQWDHIIEDIKKASLCLQACSFCHVSRG